MSESHLKFSQSYWENRYLNNQTEWDAKGITTPLKEYFDQLTNKELKILIPGGGNSYEAEYLHNKGFSNVFLVDIARQPLENIKSRSASFPDEHLIHGNFFTHDAAYDIIVEQTFFCALHPDERGAYAKKMAGLLVPSGKLTGLLFDARFEGGPPFGGCAEDYREFFAPYFNFRVFESCTNSIKPRVGKELFMILEKK